MISVTKRNGFIQRDLKIYDVSLIFYMEIMIILAYLLLCFASDVEKKHYECNPVSVH